MDWSPLLQTLLGAAIAISTTYLLHRHETREATRAEMRTTYAEFLQSFSDLGRHFETTDPVDTLRPAFTALGLLANKIQVLGSQEVIDGVVAMLDEIAKLGTSGDAVDYQMFKNTVTRPHRPALVNAMRKDLGLKPVRLKVYSSEVGRMVSP